MSLAATFILFSKKISQVILAATSAKLIGRPGADELLEEALATYHKHFWDDEIGLAVDTWNTESH